MEIFHFTSLPSTQSEEISSIYSDTLANIRNVSKPWFLLFMVNDNFQVKYLAAERDENGNENVDQLGQFHQDFMGYLQSAQTHCQDGFSNIEVTVENLKKLSPSELYQSLVIGLSQEVDILGKFWKENPNPYLNDSSEMSIKEVLKVLSKKASECEMASQSVTSFAESGQHPNGTGNQMYLKVKVLYLVTFIYRQVDRQSNILLRHPNLKRALKWGEEDTKNWPRSPLDWKTWFSSLLKILDKMTPLWTKEQLKKLRNSPPNPNPNSHSLAWTAATALVDDSLELYRTVLCNALALEAQPPRVVKKNSPVTISLLLFIPQSIFGQVTSVSLEYKVLDKKTAQKLFKDEIEACHITGFEKVPRTELKIASHLNHVNLTFRQNITMQKPDGNHVCRQYRCFLFRVHFMHKGFRIPISAWCCSGSFVYITGNGQRSEAKGAMVWYNLFRLREGENRNENVNPNPNPGWMPLEVDEQVDISRMCSGLSRYFNDKMGTNREFTRENCEYLVGKLLKSGKNGNPGPEEADAQAHSNQVTMAMFLDKTEKRQTAGTNNPKTERYSFWDWFSQTVEFAKKHLALFWKKGFLVEFIDRISAEDGILQGRAPGTFFLRFNDFLPAGVSICYVDSQGAAHSIQPLTDQDLQNVSLLQKIQDLDLDLKSFLYHHIQLEEDGQVASWISPWGDRDLSEPEFSLPSRQVHVPDPVMTNRPYVAHHILTSIIQNHPPRRIRPAEVQIQVPAENENENEINMQVDPVLILPPNFPEDPQYIIQPTDDEMATFSELLVFSL